MNDAELAEAISASSARARARARAAALVAAGRHAWRRVATFIGALVALAWLRRARPARVLVLSVSALAAGALGIMTAYAISPDEVGSAGQVLVTNGTTYQIATVTGPGGTTTVAITKTKEGKTRVVPVRILRTVTGPGGVETVAVQVLGPERTVTDRDIQTQIETQIQTQMQTQTQVVNQTQTEVVTQIQPTTVVVTDVRTDVIREVETQHVTVIQTETVVVTETETVTVTGPPPP